MALNSYYAGVNQLDIAAPAKEICLSEMGVILAVNCTFSAVNYSLDKVQSIKNDRAPSGFTSLGIILRSRIKRVEESNEMSHLWAGLTSPALCRPRRKVPSSESSGEEYVSASTYQITDTTEAIREIAIARTNKSLFITDNPFT